jgi:2-dehydro-3-deoxy-D-arabinonate dehydratase
MRIGRVARGPGVRPQAAVASTADGPFRPIETSLCDLLALTADEMRARLDRPVYATALAAEVELVAPIEGRAEVWAAGVTYHRSRVARMAESEESADIYDRVYDAERPELFFKAASWRTVGTGRPIVVRPDSPINVPEPELALVLNRHAEIVGYTICNDVSSRSIEGENPLYLPQAKAYLGSCALGPWITPSWEIDDPYQLGIELIIERGGDIVWQGNANTSELHRRFDELVDYLFRADEFPDGVVLSTGTSLVPELPFTLTEGHLVRISIDNLGELVNPVTRGKAAMAWLL